MSIWPSSNQRLASERGSVFFSNKDFLWTYGRFGGRLSPL